MLASEVAQLNSDLSVLHRKRALGNEIDDAAKAALAEQDRGRPAHHFDLLQREGIRTHVVVKAEQHSHSVHKLAEGPAAHAGPIAAGVETILFSADSRGVAQGVLKGERRLRREPLAADDRNRLRRLDEWDFAFADRA